MRLIATYRSLSRLIALAACLSDLFLSQKKMTQAVFESRLKKAGLYTKANKLKSYYARNLYEEILSQPKNKDLKIRTYKWYWNGEYTEGYYRITVLLKALHLKYTYKNDAPRRGKNGEYIHVPKSEMQKLKGCVIRGFKPYR